MPQLLNQRLKPMPIPPRLRPRWWCIPCGFEVTPRVDSQGPHCPYCQLPIETPMERVRPTAARSEGG